MRWCNLQKIGEAPQAGQLLAYTRKNVIFQPYGALEEVEEWLSQEDLLEVHLFDEEKEYRSIATRSKRYKDGVIETVADFSEREEETLYKEQIRLENGQGMITVLNHIKYDDKGDGATGMASIDNYRLKIGGK